MQPAFIGPIFGIVICDYFLLRKQQINLNHLFSTDPRGTYWYRNGLNPRAIAALISAALLATVIAQVPAF